jgi:hypothetical protein
MTGADVLYRITLLCPALRQSGESSKKIESGKSEKARRNQAHYVSENWKSAPK